MGPQTSGPSFICLLTGSCRKQMKTDIENPHSTCTKLDLRSILASYENIKKLQISEGEKIIFPLKQKMVLLQING